MTDQPGGVSLPPQPVFDWRERLGHLVDHKSGLGDKRFGEAVVAMLYEYDALMVKARAQSLPLPPRGWQDIATAPKDRDVLAGACHTIYGWLWDRATYHKFPALKVEEWIMKNGMSPTHWFDLPLPPNKENS